MLFEISNTQADELETSKTPPAEKQNTKRIPSPSMLMRRVKTRNVECNRKTKEISPQIGTNELEKIHEERDQCKQLRWDESCPVVRKTKKTVKQAIKNVWRESMDD